MCIDASSKGNQLKPTDNVIASMSKNKSIVRSHISNLKHATIESLVDVRLVIPFADLFLGRLALWQTCSLSGHFPYGTKSNQSLTDVQIVLTTGNVEILGDQNAGHATPVAGDHKKGSHLPPLLLMDSLSGPGVFQDVCPPTSRLPSLLHSSVTLVLAPATNS